MPANAMNETPKSSKVTDRIVDTVEVECLELAMTAIRDFLIWLRREVLELSPSEEKKGREWSGCFKESCELFGIEWRELELC